MVKLFLVGDGNIETISCRDDLLLRFAVKLQCFFKASKEPVTETAACIAGFSLCSRTLRVF